MLDRCLKGFSSDDNAEDASVHDANEDLDNRLYNAEDAPNSEDEDESSEDNERLHKRLRQSFAGSEAYHKKMENVKPGPATVVGFSNFPRTLCARIWSGEGGDLRRKRALAFGEHGLVTHHDFAGRQGFEQALELLGVEFGEHGAAPHIINWRTSEKCHGTRRLIEQGKLKPEHSYATLEDVHLNAEIKLKLKQLTKQVRINHDAWIADNPAADPQEVMEAWDEAMTLRNCYWKQFIKDNGATLYKPNSASAKCRLHPGMMCPARWQDSRPLHSRAVSIGAGGPHCLPWTRSGSKKVRWQFIHWISIL